MTSTTTTRCSSRSCPRPSTSSRRSTAATSTSRSTCPLENLDSYKDNPDFTIVDEPSFFNYVGLFNTGKAPLDDPKVRQALSYAIPYDDIITGRRAGLRHPVARPRAGRRLPVRRDGPPVHQDLDKAKALLKEAGHEGGGFSMEITYASENQNEARFAPLLQDAFEQLGIDVTLTPMLFNQQWERAKGDAAGRQDMFLLLYWPTYSDAGSDNLWSLFHSSEAPFFNLSYWDDTKYDGLIDDAGTKTATDRAAAQAGYSEAMKYLVDQAPGRLLLRHPSGVPAPQRDRGLRVQPELSLRAVLLPTASGAVTA